MADTRTQYKIAVLRMLNLVSTTLSNTQITGFFTQRGYTSHFTVQQAISDLEQAGLISSTTALNSTLHSITPEGAHTLANMADKITPAMEADIRSYLEEISVEISVNNGLFAHFDKAVGGGYVVHLKFTQDNQLKLDSTIHVSSLTQAETMVNNWKARFESVYVSLLDELL